MTDSVTSNVNGAVLPLSPPPLSRRRWPSRRRLGEALTCQKLKILLAAAICLGLGILPRCRQMDDQQGTQAPPEAHDGSGHLQRARQARGTSWSGQLLHVPFKG